MNEMTEEDIIEEIAKKAIVALVGVLSSSLTIRAKRQRLLRVVDDIETGIQDSVNLKNRELQ